MAELGQKIVKGYLESLGFEVKKIPEREFKTPDFEVYLDGELVFFCEEKTLEYDNFVGAKKNSVFSSISSHVHKSVKQFKSVNPNKDFPNVLVFTNFDTIHNIHDLFTTLTGVVILEDGTCKKIHNVGRVAGDLDLIDLYLWFEKERFINCLVGEIDPKRLEKLKSLFEKRGL